MKKLNLNEAPKTVAFTFGRFNPPTTGHEKLCDAVKKANPSDYKIFASQSQNPKKDPLQYAKKIAYMKQSFPKHKNNIVVSKSRNIFEILVELNSYENLIMVVGSDRVTEFKRIINEYNGVKSRHGLYEYKTVKVLSAGARDPDAEGVEGMSASKMRAAAVDSDFDSFKLGTPLNDAQAKKLYFDVRKSMGIREELNLSDLETLRELYLSEQIWNVGDLIKVKGKKDDTLPTWEIIRRGTNYVTVIDENYKSHKVWLHDIDITEDYTHYPSQVDPKKDKSDGWITGDPTKPIAFDGGDTKSILDKANKEVEKERGVVQKQFVEHVISEVKQDKEIKDREGTQPAKYYAKDTEGDAMAKSTKKSRARHFAKYGKKDTDSDAAYKPAPGDARATTKPSKHTKKFKQMFGEDDGCWDTHKKVGMKKKGNRMVPNCVPKEEDNPRIPRKKGQPAGSDSHSDLYTDENPEGTIQGLGFKDVETAKSSVAKIERSDRTHAHKIQAAVAMEQRAKEMGKTAEAGIYRTYIEKMKKKTKRMREFTEFMYEKAPDTEDAMKRYKSGKAGFTDIAHLKAKGLIKRADGTKKKSEKYEVNEALQFYPKDLKDFIQIPDYPKDDVKEMGTIRKIISTRTDEDVESVANNDEDSFYSIKEYLKKMKVKFHENELRDIVQQAVPTIRYFKNKFNRSRPFELDGNLDVLGSTTNKTRSYPSGHSTQAMIVALYVAQKFPEHKDGLMEAAKEVGMGRVKAGFHFLSDHVAGQMLGTKMFEHMNKEDYGQSMKEYYEVGTDNYVNYLRDITPGEDKKKEYKQVREEPLNEWGEIDEDAEYQGKKVKLNNPVRGGSKKFYVYVKNDKGNVVKVSFGDSTGLSIKRDDPERRKAFRARHNCDQKKDKTTPGYWSCKFWEKGKSVTDLMKG
jgi:hypothetical protein